jgi:tetratricopeptide (TPR) repeat protein
MRPGHFVASAAGVALLALAGSAAALPMEGPLPVIQRPKFDPASEFQAGMAAEAKGDYAEAKRHFQNVLSISPDHPATLYQLGLTEQKLGDLKSAAKDYEAALHARPGMVEAVLALAVTDAKLGRTDQARMQLVKLKHYQQTCAGACAQAGDIDAAVHTVETSLAAPARAAKAPGS